MTNNDYEVVWAGRGSLTRDEGWQMRRNSMLDRAPDNKDWPTQEDGRKSKDLFDKHPWTHKKQRSRKGLKLQKNIKVQ